MNPEVKGLHHITIMSGDPTTNAEFYVNTLGMRMVKKTVNHDAPSVYHLFYGDKKGTPGSSITFFPNMTDRETREGAGLVTEMGLRVPEDSVDYWADRLEEEDVEFAREDWHGEETLAFEDPDGLNLRIVPEDTDLFTPWEDSRVPEEHQVRGMHHVTMSVSSRDNMKNLLETMSLEETEEDYFVAEDSSKVELKLTSTPARPGKGSVHHIAFKVEDEEEQEKWRVQLQRIGMMPSPLVDRKYFKSVYVRTPSQILFEFATMGPGYTADEAVEELGSSLVLPDKLEDSRSEIEEKLPEFDESNLP